MDESELKTLDLLENSHWWYRIRKDILKTTVSRYGSNLQILDAGSATGGNSLMLSEMGHFVVSVEKSKFGIEAQRLKKIDVVEADIGAMPFPDESFDVVVCLDVLEHICDDLQAVKELFRVLRKNGIAIIAVPESMKLWSAHDIAVNHLRRYEKKDLLHLLRDGNFKIIDSWSVNRYIRPVILFLRRRSTSSSLKSVNPILNSILYVIARIDFATRKILSSGVTIWIVARK